MSGKESSTPPAVTVLIKSDGQPPERFQIVAGGAADAAPTASNPYLAHSPKRELMADLQRLQAGRKFRPRTADKIVIFAAV